MFGIFILTNLVFIFIKRKKMYTVIRKNIVENKKKPTDKLKSNL